MSCKMHKSLINVALWGNQSKCLFDNRLGCSLTMSVIGYKTELHRNNIITMMPQFYMYFQICELMWKTLIQQWIKGLFTISAIIFLILLLLCMIPIWVLRCRNAGNASEVRHVLVSQWDGPVRSTSASYNMTLENTP